MNKPVKILLIILIVSASFGLQAKKVPLPDLMKPASIVVDESRLYISEGPSVHIYSLTGFKKEKTFGSAGEGPKEFIVHTGFGVSLALWKDNLLVGDNVKMSYYTKDGTYIKEVRCGKRGGFYPLGDAFVITDIVTENNIIYQTLNLYNREFKKFKEVCRWEHAIQDAKKQIMLAPEYTQHHFYKDKLFVAPGKDFVIQVFNGKGEKLQTLQYDYEKLKVTEDYKRITLNFFKTDPRYRKHYESIKSLFAFPEYFPAIRSFAVNDGRIYVRTYENKDGKSEYYIFSTEGKLLKKVFVPFVETMGINILPRYTISGTKLYQLVENEEREEWELHIRNLD